MSAQGLLFDPGPQDGGLTPRQQLALDALTAEPDGLAADEIGAILHEQKDGRWRHDRGERCQFCGKDGRHVLNALRQRGIARSNRLGVWRATGRAVSRPSGPSLKTFADTGDDIPF